MMRDAILNFGKQFAFEPVIENRGKLPRAKSFIVSGMGGSHLGADVVERLAPELSITVHSDYGLPHLSYVADDTLVICSSYSGNTEETLSAYDAAKKQGLVRAVIAVGGTLLAQAKKDGVSYVVMPDTGIQPRSALGFNLMGLLKFMGREDLLRASHKFSQSFDPQDFESEGKKLAQKLKDKVPVIYTSLHNYALAYNWKIKLNETGKIPAFYNVFPELNHNEMTGLDVQDSSRHLSKQFYFIFIHDEDDHPQVQKRMEVCAKLYRDRGLSVEVLELKGNNDFEKIFSSLVLADWTAVYIAEHYGLESEQVPMVEEFKLLIA